MSLEAILTELTAGLKEHTAALKQHTDLLRQVSGAPAPDRVASTQPQSETPAKPAKATAAAKPAKTVPELTTADVAKAVGAVVTALGRETAIAMLKRHGAPKASDLSKDKYAVVIAEAGQLVEAAEAAALAEAEADPTV